MKKVPAWQPFSLQFKQGFDGAYGFLDRCGKFVAMVREQFGFYSTETLPTGCALELPDRNMFLTANCNELNLIQEGSSDDKFFVEVAQFTSRLAIDYFEPFEVFKNDFTFRLARLTASLDEAHEFSLQLFGNEVREIAKLVSLEPKSKEVKLSFKSGSYELDIQCQPIVLTVNGRNLAVPQHRSPKAQSSYIDKVREAASRRAFEPGYAIMLTFELSESEPTNETLGKHLGLLRKYAEQVTSKYP